MHIGSSSTRVGSGNGLVLEGPHDAKVLYVLKFSFKARNNEAKYEALIVRLKLVKDMGIEQIQAL